MGVLLLGRRIVERSARRPHSTISCVVEAKGFSPKDGRVVWRIVCIVKKVNEMNFMYIDPKGNPPPEEVIHAAVKAAEEAEAPISGVAVIGEENYEKYQAMVERELEKRGLLAK